MKYEAGQKRTSELKEYSVTLVAFAAEAYDELAGLADGKARKPTTVSLDLT